MATRLTELANFLSDSSAVPVAASARRVAAIRLGARRHLCATLWSSDIAITCSRLLPDQDSYLLLMDDGHAIAHLAWRDKATGLAGLRLAAPYPLPACPPPQPIAEDSWLLSVGIDDKGQPVPVLATPKIIPAGSPPKSWFHIDRKPGDGDFGGPLIAPSGALVGIISDGGAPGPGVGQARVIPYSAIMRLVGEPHELKTSGPQAAAPVMAKDHAGSAVAGNPLAGPPDAETGQGGGSGWLGVGLQPSALSRAFAAVAGQRSGRKVFDIVPDGPADLAGLRSGDIVLSIANQSMVGDGAVRRFLSRAKIGETAEIVALRAGELIRLNITVSESPAG